MKRMILAGLTVVFSTSIFAFQLEEASIDSIQTAIKSNQISCEQLIQSYINRILQFDLSAVSSAPINAITEINTSALNDARLLDTKFAKNHQLLGPLHCIPVILKDHIDAYDLTSTAGSYSLLGNQPIKDAFLTSQLRKAGAIILAKGGMDEFAWGMMGISSRNGRIGNAYDANKNPGGSSGGPAAAVSANFAVAGIGSDNSGSIRIPAVFNGLVGLRPSAGLISQSGIFPMGKIDGVPGPMTRTVTDLAKILDVITQSDPTDSKTQSIPRPTTYTAFLNEHGLQGKRIGIVHKVGKIETFKNMSAELNNLINQTYTIMKQLGASFVNIDLNEFDNNRSLNQAGEIQDVNAYLESYPAARKNFTDICESDRTRNFGSIKKCLQFVKKTEAQKTKEINQAYAIFAKNKDYVNKIMEKNHLDALFIPISTKGIATYDGDSVNTWRAPVSSNTGMPSIAFVIGYLQNMPVGIELVGKQYAEPTLIEIAYAFEKHSPARKIPTIPTTNNELLHISIPQFNNIINMLGKITYDKVLKTNGNNEKKLTPGVFQKITRSVL